MLPSTHGVTCKAKTIMSTYPLISLIYDRKGKAASSGVGLVEVRVTWRGSRAYFSTALKLRPSAWDTRQHMAKGAGSSTTNYRLRAIRDRVEVATADLWRDQRFSLAALRQKLQPEQPAALAPAAWIKAQIARRNIRESTKKQHLVMLRNFEASGLFDTWQQVTLSAIEKWDTMLRASSGVTHQSTVHSYHKRLKPYLRLAVRDGLIAADPYVLFKSSRGERDTVDYLTEAERDAIDGLSLDGMADKARDLFIFSCYTGLSYIDMAHWDNAMVVDGGDGVKYIIGRRRKTGERYLTILPARAREILQKWGGLPTLSNQKCNLALKVIAPAAGITKRLTLHMARHTFATWELHHGIDLKTVSATLGHSSVTSTEIYAKTLEADVKMKLRKLGK